MVSTPAQIVLPCAICNSKSPSNYDLLYELHDCDIVKCRTCGLVYVNALFEEVKKVAGKVYASEIYEQIGKTLLRRFAVDIQRIESLSGKGRILDVGCGYGYFLTLAKEHGWDCSGVEINQELVNYLNTNKGLQVRCGTLGEQKFDANSFDVVTMFNLIEHLLYPAEALSEVYRILRKGGLLVIETPTEDGLFKKIAAFLYKLTSGRFKTMARGAYQKGGHHFGFSRQSIRTILEKHGFEILSIEGRMSPFVEFMKKEILGASLPMKIVKVLVIPVLWGISEAFSMQNRMIVYARKRM